MSLSTEQRAELVRHLLKRYAAFVRDKDDTEVIRAVAEVFDVAAFFGAGVPSGEEFMTRYWTTLGPVVFAPKGHGPLAEHLLVLCHELTHVVQFWRDSVGFVLRYCTRKGRAELEAEAERAAIEVAWLLTGTIPPQDALAITRHGYALDEAHAVHTINLLHTAVTSIANGVISTDVGLEALAWLRAYASDAIVGKVASS